MKARLLTLVLCATVIGCDKQDALAPTVLDRETNASGVHTLWRSVASDPWFLTDDGEVWHLQLGPGTWFQVDSRIPPVPMSDVECWSPNLVVAQDGTVWLYNSVWYEATEIPIREAQYPRTYLVQLCEFASGSFYGRDPAVRVAYPDGTEFAWVRRSDETSEESGYRWEKAPNRVPVDLDEIQIWAGTYVVTDDGELYWRDHRASDVPDELLRSLPVVPVFVSTGVYTTADYVTALAENGRVWRMNDGYISEDMPAYVVPPTPADQIEHWAREVYVSIDGTVHYYSQGWTTTTIP